MNHSSKFLMLKDINIIKTLSEAQINELAKRCTMEKVHKKNKIYCSGQTIDYVYLVNKGSIKLGMVAECDKILIKDIVYDHELFGENIFAKNVVRKDFSEAMSDTIIFKIPTALFKELVETNSEFANAVMTVIIERIRNLEQRMQNFVFMKAKARIVDFIRKTGNRKGIKIGVDEILINHSMSHKDIAYLTDTSRQTVARVLGELKKDNLIHFSPRKPSKILIRHSFQLAL